MTYKEAKKLKNGTLVFLINPYTNKTELVELNQSQVKPSGYIYTDFIRPYDYCYYEDMFVLEQPLGKEENTKHKKVDNKDLERGTL